MFSPTRDDGEAPITATDRGASSGCKSLRVITRAPLYGAWDQPQGSMVRGPIERALPPRRRPRPGRASPLTVPVTVGSPVRRGARPPPELPNGARASMLTQSPRSRGGSGDYTRRPTHRPLAAIGVPRPA